MSVRGAGEPRDRPLTTPEALAASLVGSFAALILVAYLWGRLAPISPFALLGFSAAVAVLMTRALLRRAVRTASGAIAAAAVFIVVLGWILALGWPSLLPPGRGADLAHHLTLIEHVDRTWRLPDGSLAGVMNEMAHYTPGVHLLAVLAGAWARSDGFHALYPVVAVTVALKTVFVLLIALRTIPPESRRMALAVGAVVLCVLPTPYVLGSFAHDSFFAQAAAELFAVAMWWAIVVWDTQPVRLPLVLFAAAGVGAVLTWPMWIGAPLVALAAVVLTREDLRVGERVTALSIACAAPLAVLAMHAVGRAGWLTLAGTSGGVLRPSIEAFGRPFAAIALVGVLATLRRRHARATLLLTLAIAAQALTLYAVARSAGASTPYMAFKMMYLIVYPLAVLGAAGIARAFRSWPSPAARWQGAVAWAVPLVVLAAATAQPAAFVRATPIVSSDLYDAGRWARRNIEAACVDYLVPHADTMYWLHLAVLGNARVSWRTANPDTFDPQRAVARWIEPGGLPYAIAHLPTVPKEVLAGVDVLEQFGEAAVVLRRGPAFCAEAERHALRLAR